MSNNDKLTTNIISFFKDFLTEYHVTLSKDDCRNIYDNIEYYIDDFIDDKRNSDSVVPFARDYASDICDIFETLLDEKDITLPDEGREGDYCEARIFDNAYYRLEDGITDILELT